ncbi:MAG TPA: site-specific integrase, partial [Gemmatimonadaceae bacterium]
MTTATLPGDIARAWLLEPFEDYLAVEQGSADRTREAYARDVSRLASFALSRGKRRPADLDIKLLREFVYHLKDLGLAASSIRRNVSSLRTYFAYLLAEGQIQTDPSERLELPRRWRTLPDVLTADEVSRLLAAPRHDDPLYYRDRAMLEVAYGAGLRVSEWISLTLRDVRADEGIVRVFG